MAVFGNKKTQEEGPEHIISIIAAGTTILGDVVSEGDIRVEGHIIGKLVCHSRLVIGRKGNIEGNVDASNATVAGQIHGTVVVRDLLHVQNTGLIRGDIIAGRIVVDDGGEYSGNSKTGAAAREELKTVPIPDLLPKRQKARPADNQQNPAVAQKVPQA